MDLKAYLILFWEWVAGIQHWNTMEGWVARILAWVIFAYLLLLLLKHVLGVIANICESWKTLGLDVKKSPEEIGQLRRRQQFYKVLGADLSMLAKAESWNDQFFTDLEAEVEAEGGYYASRTDRLLNRKSQGLRRVPSLIEAIDSSTEQCLLVTGEPGSGKSVALRHLANKLVERGLRSKSLDEKIPLYVNLKELPPAPREEPSADFIKDFVLENIRRGDADTAAYVRENWSINRERGRWFFLFDSFDEIPAVLHAPTGSQAIREHADAIRQFFEGMSACRGVLASREFKGPDALPWKRFKILSLSLLRQEELIGNSFLSEDQKVIAVQHTASTTSGILTNPLFLTLLCRYIKEENRPPLNDKELLLKHIERLAHREPEYVLRKYQLTPRELIDGSIKLALLFAEQPSLSLAPTQDQIALLLQHACDSDRGLGNLLAALIDVKIGRCDVKEASPGDRRFTFAHRRYQETLFVQYLTTNPSYLSSEALLTDLRWRDYTVTLLQTSSVERLSPLLSVAASLLIHYAVKDRTALRLPDYGIGAYFEWRNSPATLLIRLLQEGLSRRLQLVTDKLRKAVEKFLEPRWSYGDSYDRLMVITLGTFLPDSTLGRKIKWAVRKGTAQHWDASVTTAAFCSTMPEGMAGWFRVQLAKRLLLARNRAEILSLEAVAARSPKSIGSTFIVNRIRVIRRLFQTFDIIRPGRGSLGGLLAKMGEERRDLRFELARTNQLIYLSILPLIPIVLSVQLWEKTRAGAMVAASAGAFLIEKVVRHLWLFFFRAVGCKLTTRSIWVDFKRRGRFAKPVLSWIAPLAVVAGSMAGIGGLSHFAARKVGYRGEVVLLYLIVPLGVIATAGVIAFMFEFRRERRSLWRLRQVTTEGVGRTILKAASWKEASIWLKANPARLIESYAEAHSCLGFAKDVERGKSVIQNRLNNPKDLSTVSKEVIRRLIKIVVETENQWANDNVAQAGAGSSEPRCLRTAGSQND